jgi:hypothetical protein
MTTAPTAGLKLGRRAPSNKPALHFGAMLRQVPDHPLAVDHLRAVTNWRMLGNDRHFDCGPVAVANSRALITKALTGREAYPALSSVYDLYRRSGNPQFNPGTGEDDNGVDMQTMLGAVAHGGIAGHKAVAFAKVNIADLDEVKAAIAIFGFVLLGVDLQHAQATGSIWDYVPHSPEWGGHAILGANYTADGRDDVGGVSWAKVVGLTDAFWTHRAEEAWAVVWPEALSTHQFQQGIDTAALADAYQSLTGRALVLPVVRGRRDDARS